MSRKYVWEPLYPIAKRDPEEAIRQLDLRMTRLFRDLSRSVQRQHLEFTHKDIVSGASGEDLHYAADEGLRRFRIDSNCFAIGFRASVTSLNDGNIDLFPVINNVRQTDYEMSFSSSVEDHDIRVPYRDLFVPRGSLIGFDFDTGAVINPAPDIFATWFLAFTGED